MSSAFVYNIPAKLIDNYRGQQVIIRSSVPGEIIQCLQSADLTSIRSIQLLSTSADWGFLDQAWRDLPLEIVLRNPIAEYAQLYKFSTLANSRQVRVIIPVVPGFSKATKLAASLNFAVKLELQQPNYFVIEELKAVLDLYLQPSLLQKPIEFFHTMILSFHHHIPITMWEVAEENPELVRYITDEGNETISSRFAGRPLPVLDHFVENFSQQMVSEERECHNCEFFNRCASYFKWPHPSYNCDGVKSLFQALRKAADEVANELTAGDLDRRVATLETASSNTRF